MDSRRSFYLAAREDEFDFPNSKRGLGSRPITSGLRTVYRPAAALCFDV